MAKFKFKLGRLVCTPGVMQSVPVPEMGTLIKRHHACDWGDLEDDDWVENERALLAGDRLFSSYHTRRGLKVWIITEADRSSTCVLLPDEY